MNPYLFDKAQAGQVHLFVIIKLRPYSSLQSFFSLERIKVKREKKGQESHGGLG